MIHQQILEELNLKMPAITEHCYKVLAEVYRLRQRLADKSLEANDWQELKRLMLKPSYLLLSEQNVFDPLRHKLVAFNESYIITAKRRMISKLAPVDLFEVVASENVDFNMIKYLRQGLETNWTGIMQAYSRLVIDLARENSPGKPN
jgi:hypothetical protein